MGCWLSGPWTGEQTAPGRSQAHLSQREALRILAASQYPITMQVKSQRGRGLQDCSTKVDRETWEVLPLSLQHLNLPHPQMEAGHNASSPSYQDRRYYSRLSLPQDHCDAGRFGYLPSAPRDTVDISQQDPELMSHQPKGRSCLMGCCNGSSEDPSGCHSQTDDEDFILEKALGLMPLHHELDSGLGWTDGSLHQGDLSGLETEEGGLEDCHQHIAFPQGGCGGFGGGSPSSESFISSELSDSGFYSVSAGEFRHFQRLLEKRMRLYNARIQHQGESCERRERRDSCPKSHRELLEAIPEALTMQPQCQHMQMEMEMEDDPGHMLDPSQNLFRVSSVQFHKNEQPCLNRHSSSSGALFNPSQSHTAASRIGPVLSTCSTPSSHRRPLVPIQQLQSQSSASMGILRRSRTLHHRPPVQEYRRRASHPASPSYCAATLHHCGTTVPPGVPEEGELMVGVMGSQPGLATSPHQHSSTLEHIIGTQSDERCYNNSSNANGQHVHHDWWHSQERIHMPERDRDLEREIEQERQKEQERELEIQEGRQQELEQRRARERQHFESLCHPPQSGDVNDTWPKPASRQTQGGGGGGGLYSTLEGHTCPGAVTGWDSKKGHMDGRSNISPSLQQKPNPNSKPSTSSRLSRSQFLRDRASQLADERSGMSTDEETNTDMLMGRYWSRTERKEHFMLAREQRQQHQAKGGTPRDLVTRAVASAGGGAISAGDRSPDIRGGGAFADGRCNTVLEMSQRKLSRLRNRKLLDDWTTVEELLTHGNRLNSQEDTLCPSSLLTVTTV